ncbi:YbaB/EbfC family nucleoid-associated protein [Cellulomonas sp. NPDC089187]|uniref:YbaB/EbfC family nucleoid-associated protein n=1 Tax=Cellulomonas sp. NPDC089187 TaxID=3154970 RepID=UPI003428532F
MPAFHEPDTVLARIQQDIGAAQERAARATEVRQQMDAIRGAARSPRGEVAAVVDPSGRLTDLTFTDDALRLSARELSRLTLDTVRRAGAEAGRQAVDLMSDSFGADSQLTEHLRNEVAARQL